MEEKLPPGSYRGSWVWCFEPTDPALRSLRQEDFLDYIEASLDYTVRPRLKKQNKIIGGGRRNWAFRREGSLAHRKGHFFLHLEWQKRVTITQLHKWEGEPERHTQLSRSFYLPTETWHRLWKTLHLIRLTSFSGQPTVLGSPMSLSPWGVPWTHGSLRILPTLVQHPTHIKSSPRVIWGEPKQAIKSPEKTDPILQTPKSLWEATVG